MFTSSTWGPTSFYTDVIIKKNTQYTSWEVLGYPGNAQCR